MARPADATLSQLLDHTPRTLSGKPFEQTEVALSNRAVRVGEGGRGGGGQVWLRDDARVSDAASPPPCELQGIRDSFHRHVPLLITGCDLEPVKHYLPRVFNVGDDTAVSFLGLNEPTQIGTVSAALDGFDEDISCSDGTPRGPVRGKRFARFDKLGLDR